MVITMRIQLELAEDDVQELKDLMEEARIGSYKDLFSNALTLLYWAVREVKNGRVIASLNEKEPKYKELAMPILENLAKAGQKAGEKELAAMQAPGVMNLHLKN